MSIPFTLERAFWTPVIVATLDEAESINAALEPTILERYAQRGFGDPEATGARSGGWQSGHDLLSWGGEPARAIRDAAIELAEAHTDDILAGRADRPRGWASKGWANLCGHGTYNRQHAHGDAYWAAVYYVRVDPGEGGELVLHDPRAQFIDMHAPRLRFAPSGGEMAINLPPRAGMLLVFPGWLQHSIAPYFGDGHRISVAMNLSARFGVAATADPEVAPAGR